MKKITCILLASLIMLSACGQKGALYVPVENEKAEEENTSES